MAFDLLSRAFSKTWVSNKVAQEILVYIHYSSPVILLAFFLIAFTAHSIATASDEHAVKPATDRLGPGGKPLPQNTRGKPKAKALDFSRGRKLLFNWLSVGTILSFLGNAAVVILHAVIERKDNWWCGQAVAVGGDLSNLNNTILRANWNASDLRRRLLLRLYSLPHFLAGHQTLADSSALFNLACSSGARANRTRSLAGNL